MIADIGVCILFLRFRIEVEIRNNCSNFAAIDCVRYKKQATRMELSSTDLFFKWKDVGNPIRTI